MSVSEKQALTNELVSANLYHLKHLLEQLQPEELADAFNQCEPDDVYRIFQLIPPEKAVLTFENLDSDTQRELLSKFNFQQLSQTLNLISADDRTALFEKLSHSQLENYLSLLSDEERKTARALLLYPEESIGRRMTPDFVSVKQDWNVQQVLDYIRAYGKDSETLSHIYVTDARGVLIDDISVREFLLAPTTKKVSEIMDRQFVSLDAHDDQEKAIKLFKETNRTALPVTDFNGILLGIVTVDDVIDVMEQEDTEDIQKFGGTEALDEPYLKIDLSQMIKKRAGWLVFLFLGEMFTATAMSYFNDELNKATVLALFIPLIISSGGNSGSQAATLIIRALALGEVTVGTWWRVVRREFITGISLGVILACIGFLRITIWSAFYPDLYTSHWMLVAFSVSVALVGVVLWGTLAGSLLPLIIKRLGADPATSSAPFIATLVDVTGIVIYFTVSFVVLHDTLLANPPQ